jgi:F0F1-type ATP synthase assembly protein I
MADLSSRDDEKTAEQARQKGIEEEKQRQKELAAAKEQSRKEGMQQERSKSKGNGGSAVKIILGLVVLVIILLAIAWFTLNVSVSGATPGLALPFTTSYAVTFPEGQTINVGNSQIAVLSYQNELISSVDGDRQKLVVGEDRVISQRRAVITTLGKITLLDTNFQITLKYKGERDNQAYFDMAVHTSQQVPDILLKQLLPPEIHATPI